MKFEVHRQTPDIIGSSPGEEAEHACMGPSDRLIDEKKPDTAVRTRSGQR
jgi:hypothetical protein